VLDPLPLPPMVRRLGEFLALAQIDFARIVDAHDAVVVADLDVPAVVRRLVPGFEFGPLAHD